MGFLITIGEAIIGLLAICGTITLLKGGTQYRFLNFICGIAQIILFIILL